MLYNISVIITCHNQAANLNRIVKVLQMQSLKPDEVIIADDNSFQPIEAISRNLDCKYVCTCSYKKSPHIARRSLARQLGTMAAKGDLILYLDGDIIPSLNVVEFVWLNHTRYNYEVITKIPRMFRISMRRQLIANMYLMIQNEVTLEPLSFENFQSDCFSATKRSIIEVGGWDIDFLGWGEEDVELAYRFHLAKTPIQLVKHPKLYGIHIDHAIDHIENGNSMAKNAQYFAKKHPEIKSMRDYFWKSLDNYYTSYYKYNS